MKSLFLVLSLFFLADCPLYAAKKYAAKKKHSQSAKQVRKERQEKTKKKVRKRFLQEITCVMCTDSVGSGPNKSVVLLGCHPTHAFCLKCVSTHFLQPGVRLDPHCPICRKKVTAFDYENEEVARLVSNYASEGDVAVEVDPAPYNEVVEKPARVSPYAFGVAVAWSFVNMYWMLFNMGHSMGSNSCPALANDTCPAWE